MKILAAIVTYNRRALLERCIDHVRSQNRPPDRLLVINNSSPDDTIEMLNRKRVDHVTQPNVGSAGGWRRALDSALEGGFDATWLMDDDGFPAPDALAQLEATLKPGIACASSVVVREHDRSRFVFPFPVLNSRGLPVLFAERRKLHTLGELEAMAKDGCYPFAHLFNGALVRTDVLRHIGNVDDRFFLMGDEVDFFMRMRRHGEVVSNLRAYHYHPDVTGRPLDAAKFYYYVKNTIILNQRYFDKPALRNLAAVGAAVWRTARRNSAREALSYLAGAKLPVLWKAVRRGLHGQVGRDFND